VSTRERYILRLAVIVAIVTVCGLVWLRGLH
jgi:hypothetical protein